MGVVVVVWGLFVCKQGNKHFPHRRQVTVSVVPPPLPRRGTKGGHQER